MSRPTPPVTRLRATDAEDLLGMVEELTRRVDYLTRTAEQHEAKLGRAERALDEHAEALDAHEDRLNILDAATPKREPSLAERVEQFVNAHPGLRLTATTVAESMDLADLGERKRVHSAMVSLASAGRIGVDVREGRNRVFYANPAPAASGGAS